MKDYKTSCFNVCFNLKSFSYVVTSSLLPTTNFIKNNNSPIAYRVFHKNSVSPQELGCRFLDKG